MQTLRPMSPKLQSEIVDLVGRIGEAARRMALDATASALSSAKDDTSDAADRLREIADQVLSRAVLMQCEIELFLAGKQKPQPKPVEPTAGKND